ncbi:Gliding motility lipoprotein GldH [Arenibacter antarcticus]|uniref:Gliding motility lipoprotein GldH n=1 Tax=Arenibacter antarcticus TaxID=2040469 RepID=A0ABW5VB25_9FLAO|nr:gliding motility lipoprotein GldH [Arenibacter sp. H213]MCM4167922.1 gliding motility lipoprotein GldH [Arenibacter sp. H213]
MLRGLASLFMIVLLASCDGQTIRSVYYPTDNGTWHKDSVMQFNFSDLDTVHPFNLFINIRNDQTYPYSNLFLIAELQSPNGDQIRDTIEYEMALPNGQWLGSGNGSLKENKLWYKENIVFPSSGEYTLKVSQAMRKNGQVDGIMELEGITDVGYQIEKINP